MSEPHSSKKNKTQPGSEKKRDGTPRKMTKTRSTHKGERLMAFTLTYKDLEDDDADNFLVTRPEKDSGRLIALHHIPKVWSVKSLAKMFSELTKIYNNSSHGTFEDTVRAIINAALVLNPTLINASFSTTYESSSKRDYDQDKSNFASFVAKNATTDTRTSVKRFYYAITTGNWYPEESERCYDKERAKIIMTWLTSYIIIHAYGDREEMRSQYGKKAFPSLLGICQTDLGNVVQHFTKFFQHSISKAVLIMNVQDIYTAKFLPTIREANYDIDSLALKDAELLCGLKSQDVEAGECLKTLTSSIVAQSEFSLRKKVEKQKELKDQKHVLNRQAFLLNMLEGRSKLDQYQKRRYEDELCFINDLRSMYYKYRSKSSMPPSCSIRQFWDGLKAIVIPLLETTENRPTATEEQYPSESIEIKVLKEVQLVSETIVLEPCELEEKLEATDKKSDDNLNAQDQHNDDPPDDDVGMNSAEEESQNDIKESPVAHTTKNVVRTLNFDNEKEGMSYSQVIYGNSPGRVNIVLTPNPTMMKPESLSVSSLSEDYEMGSSLEDPVKGSPASESSKSVPTPPAVFANPHQDLLIINPTGEASDDMKGDLSEDENISDNMDVVY